MAFDKITIQELRKKAEELRFEVYPDFATERIALRLPGYLHQWEGTGAECIAFLHGYALARTYGAR